MKPAETHRQRFKPIRPTRRFMACTRMDSTVFRVIHFLPPLLMADAHSLPASGSALLRLAELHLCTRPGATPSQP